MATASREDSELREQRRRLSTRHLGSFVAAATPAAAMMIAPGAAQATTYYNTFYSNCLNPGQHTNGPGRTPNWMVASTWAFHLCGHTSTNLGWVRARVFSSRGSHSVSQNGHGSATTPPLYYSAFKRTMWAQCFNTGANAHHQVCRSKRSF
jgi:hypothetical protein